MIAELIEKAGQANAQSLECFDTLQRALESLQRTQRVNDKLVIGAAMRALGRCLEADGLSPGAREQVRNAHRMCRAAMGLE